MPLRARLRHVVTIERPTRGARNEYGIKSQDWGTVATHRAWVQPTTSREVSEPTEGGSLRAEYTMFTLVHDIRQNDRVVFNGETYQVLRVINPAGKDHHLEVGLVRITVV